MNTAILLGRLTKDPEVRYTQGDNPTAICNFGIAVDRAFKKDEVDFIPCTAFGKTAEFMDKYLAKGTRILVSGRIQVDNYTTKEGQKATATKVIVNSVEFADAKTQKQPAPAPATDQAWMPADDLTDEELPFNF